MSEQKTNREEIILTIGEESYQFKNKWEKTVYEKNTQILPCLSGLTVLQAKEILQGLNRIIESSTIIN